MPRRSDGTPPWAFCRDARAGAHRFVHAGAVAAEDLGYDVWHADCRSAGRGVCRSCLRHQRRPAGPAACKPRGVREVPRRRSEEHTSELQSHVKLVCRLLLEKKKKVHNISFTSQKKKK